MKKPKTNKKQPILPTHPPLVHDDQPRVDVGQHPSDNLTSRSGASFRGNGDCNPQDDTGMLCAGSAAYQDPPDDGPLHTSRDGNQFEPAAESSEAAASEAPMGRIGIPARPDSNAQLVASIANKVRSPQPIEDAQSLVRQLLRSETLVPTSGTEGPDQNEIWRSRWQSTKALAAPPWNSVGSGPWTSQPPRPERWTAPRPTPAVPRVRSPPPPAPPGTHES